MSGTVTGMVMALAHAGAGRPMVTFGSAIERRQKSADRSERLLNSNNLRALIPPRSLPPVPLPTVAATTATAIATVAVSIAVSISSVFVTCRCGRRHRTHRCGQRSDADRTDRADAPKQRNSRTRYHFSEQPTRCDNAISHYVPFPSVPTTESLVDALAVGTHWPNALMVLT